MASDREDLVPGRISPESVLEATGRDSMRKRRREALKRIAAAASER